MSPETESSQGVSGGFGRAGLGAVGGTPPAAGRGAGGAPGTPGTGPSGFAGRGPGAGADPVGAGGFGTAVAGRLVPAEGLGTAGALFTGRGKIFPSAAVFGPGATGLAAGFTAVAGLAAGALLTGGLDVTGFDSAAIGASPKDGKTGPAETGLALAFAAIGCAGAGNIPGAPGLGPDPVEGAPFIAGSASSWSSLGRFFGFFCPGLMTVM